MVTKMGIAREATYSTAHEVNKKAVIPLPFDGAAFLEVSRLAADFVERTFPGMTHRRRQVGFDLATELVKVSPDFRFRMGGVRIDIHYRKSPDGLFVAGEDAGCVHGANKLGGNGVWGKGGTLGSRVSLGCFSETS